MLTTLRCNFRFKKLWTMVPSIRSPLETSGSKLLEKVGTESSCPQEPVLKRNLAGIRRNTSPILPHWHQPLQLPRFNPYHEFRYGVSIQQELWKNFAARLVRLEKKLRDSESKNSSFQKQISSQDVQFQTASLYIQLIGLNKNLTFARQLEKESELFLKQTEDRRKAGRADHVDVATAETERIKNSSMVLDLRLQRDQVRLELQHLCLGPNRFFTKPFPKYFPRMPRNISKSESIKNAFAKRLDIKLIENLEESIRVHDELLQENEKPAIKAFASLSRRGIDSSFADAKPRLLWKNLELWGDA